MDKFYICTKSCTSLPVQYIAGKIYKMDEDGCIYGEDGCGRYPEDTDSEFREATKLEIEIEKYFQGHWSGTETYEQCNTSMSFTPPAIKRMVEYFYNLGKEEIYNYHQSCGARGRLGGIPEDVSEKAEKFADKMEPPYDKDDICSAFEKGAMSQREDYHWVSDHAIKLIQKSWYQEGWCDHKFDNPAQFELGKDEKQYNPSRMSIEEVQALIDRNYDMGRKDKEEEMMKLAFTYRIIGTNTINNLNMDELAKRDIHWGDKVKVIVLKDE